MALDIEELEKERRRKDSERQQNFDAKVAAANAAITSGISPNWKFVDDPSLDKRERPKDVPALYANLNPNLLHNGHYRRGNAVVYHHNGSFEIIAPPHSMDRMRPGGTYNFHDEYKLSNDLLQYGGGNVQGVTYNELHHVSIKDLNFFMEDAERRAKAGHAMGLDFDYQPDKRPNPIRRALAMYAGASAENALEVEKLWLRYNAINAAAAVNVIERAHRENGQFEVQTKGLAESRKLEKELPAMLAKCGEDNGKKIELAKQEIKDINSRLNHLDNSVKKLKQLEKKVDAILGDTHQTRENLIKLSDNLKDNAKKRTDYFQEVAKEKKDLVALATIWEDQIKKLEALPAGTLSANETKELADISKMHKEIMQNVVKVPDTASLKEDDKKLQENIDKQLGIAPAHRM